MPGHEQPDKAFQDDAATYRALVEQAADGIFVHDEAGRLIDVNPKACDILGFTREELLAKKIGDVDPQAIPSGKPELWARVLAGEQFTFESHLCHRDGSLIPAEVTLGRVMLPSGPAILGIVRDVTHRKEHEKEYRQLIDTMNDTAFVMGFDGKFVEVNDRAVEALGYSRSELLTMGPADIDPYLSASELRRLIDEMPSDKRQVIETQHRAKDGQITPLELSSSLVSYQGKTAILSIGRDITERKRADEALRALTQRNEAMLQTIPDIIVEVDASKVYVWANAAGRRFFGEAMIGREAAYYFEGEQDVYAKVDPLFKGDSDVFYVESWQRRQDGQKRLLAWWCRSLKDESGTVSGALSTARDITEQRRARELLELRARQQMAIAQMGQRALANVGLQALMDQLVASVAQTLDVVYCTILELRADSSDLLLRAGAGCGDELVGRATVDLGLNSEAGFTLQSDCPVLVDDLRTETRFEEPILLNELGVVSGMSVSIAGPDGPYGILGAHTTQRRHFTDDDIHFLQAAANILATAIQRRGTEEALRQSEARRRQLFDASPDAIFLLDAEGRYVDCNQTALDRYGYTRRELLQLRAGDLTPPELRERAEEQVRRALETGIAFEWRHRLRDGSELPVEVRAVPVSIGNERGVMSTVRDLTERKRAEEERERLQEQLSQAVKMESVGRLAGGVAHDFNNMLGVILGHAELALAQLNPSQPLYAGLQEIRKAAEHSARVTQQLLAFARRQIVAPKVLDLNESLEGMLRMLRQLIGEDINLVWSPGRNLSHVKMDPSQIDQILANLCVNARDAIEGTGTITIETASAIVDETFCAQHEGCTPGGYVRMSVSDSGGGMGGETLSHLFEPFFTTKEVGRGTGLGLAMVYGIVKQNGGFVDVSSRLGEGTTFSIYLPQHVGDSAEDVPPPRVEALPQGGGETVLLVEDEIALLALTETVLTGLNYRVLSAKLPSEALALAQAHAGEIALLVTDVVMPEMNGEELAKRVQALHPAIRIMFVSGYPADAVSSRGIIDKSVRFLQKPFSSRDLAATARALLDQK